MINYAEPRSSKVNARLSHEGGEARRARVYFFLLPVRTRFVFLQCDILTFQLLNYNVPNIPADVKLL